MILINITKVHCQTVSNRSDFTPTMLALVKDGVVHFIPLQAVHFKVIWAVHLNRCNHEGVAEVEDEYGPAQFFYGFVAEDVECD